MRSVRSGPKKLSKRRSQAAWKLLLGVMLPSFCVGGIPSRLGGDAGHACGCAQSAGMG